MNVIDVWGIKPPKVYPLKGSMGGCIYPSLIIGLELETEGLSHHIDYESLVKKIGFDAHADGSLRGNSTEFISKPMESSVALGALLKFFELTKFTEENYSDRCSIHVHVNCTDMNMEQLSAVALLYTVLEEILFEFVGGSRDSNIYCIPWNQCRNHLDLVNDFLLNPNVALKRWSKYTALNLLPLSSQGTIEFRQMHGTADMKKITTWINLIGAIFRYAKNTPLEDLVQEIRGLNTVSTYEMFFTKVLYGQLPYNEVYQAKLEEGIIFAKYSLIKHSKTGKKPEPKEIGNLEAMNKLLAELAGMAVPPPAPVAGIGQFFYTEADPFANRIGREAAVRQPARVRMEQDEHIDDEDGRDMVEEDDEEAM